MQIKLISTSDVHGYLAPTDYSQRDHVAPFGLSRAATIIQQLTQTDNDAVWPIVVDNGDFVQGSPLTYFIARQHQEAAPLYSRLANRNQVQVGVFGNHEFNYGLDFLDLCESARHYPMLAANIEDTHHRTLFAKPYTILERAGVKVAILGLTTQFVGRWELPAHLDGLKFHDVVETAKHYVPKLRELADVVVVAYHGGLERDPQTNQPTERLNGENRGSALLNEVPGIDALITGHQHRRLAVKVNGVPVTQPGMKGSNVGLITLNLNDQRQIIASQADTISTADAIPDAATMALIKPVNHQMEDWLDTPLGTINGDMLVHDHLQARLHNHPYLNFINQVEMAATGTDIAATALFNDDVPGLKPNVTLREVMNSYVYPNKLAVETITGKDLRHALERCAGYFLLKDGHVIVNPEFLHPKLRHYIYDVYSGVDYTFDLTRPLGQRVVQLDYHGQAIQPDQPLTVTLNHYRAGGGGNYPMYNTTKIDRQLSTDMTVLIADYFAKHPVVTATQPTNFKVIY
ncbi:bifunctional metallophosphatase/5'-nucleotidase [Lactiplantibacillus mudanjiangensis]|uniref:Bifunctional metallophosphatase/5'-nucleotidase [Lactobacillus sp.] n=1 Tax=Lactiplantibacillus mudanjiangensis TaxID=1296538 RepID=A0A660DZS1_9LACO|nr:bifunctional UDP-sugar hydrolase/5'-nucleotidase [Lactiplantibacillus mudanjiangensis]VDG21314.1 bifunctional metallophosphatase/5'-nucleotidase [Lactobacillus sp.] [Lactiplantibacillus mudanjiangensis]VDG23612.1 bifunctional metallophosphatase/5'-nucleotidase [Lactobacillus sp.] [Lactiplantibacillus mudanjiangensis]VDG27049.1 bifunctional metallophosphatase/5'-nucleotidase [Lactobacillus sp.] [Lactiplantibacillus mudanjiangensis]